MPARHFATASSTIVVMPAAPRGKIDRPSIGVRPDKLVNLVLQFKHFENTTAAAIADAAAALAARRLIDAIVGLETKRLIAGIGGDIGGCEDAFLLAAIAQDADQPLRDHRPQRRFEQETLDAEIEQARHRRSRGFRVQGGQHEMAGEGRMNGDTGCLGIAHFAHHDDIWILADESPHRGGESKADRGFHLRLIHALNFIFDRILDGQNLPRGLVEERQHGRESRRLAAAGRPGHDDQAMRQRQQLAHDLLVPRKQAEFGEIEQAAIARQEADHGRFAMLRRHGGDANIDVRARDPQPCRAILRQAPFGDVEAGQNLDPRDQRLRQGIGRRGHGAEQTIDPHAHHEAVAERFDMDIAGPQLHGFFEHVVDRAHHRSAAREIAQTFNIVVGAAARRSTVPGRCFLAAKLLAENRRNVLEGSDVDRHCSAKDDFGGVDGGGIARVGDGQPIGAFRGIHTGKPRCRAESVAKNGRPRRTRRRVAAK